MEDTYWLKQKPDEPLFPKSLWSRPENKRQAGKLLIVGGNLHSFKAPSGAYAAAIKASIGAVRLVLPQALERTLGKKFVEAEYAPSTTSGSFGRQALAQLIDNAEWADGVLLAGDFGNNSETATLIEHAIGKFEGPLTLAGDSLEPFLRSFEPMNRSGIVVVANLNQLQKIGVASKLIAPIKNSLDLMQFVQLLHEWTLTAKPAFMIHHQKHLIVATSGQVSTTPIAEVDLVALAAYASVWHLQQPHKPFESLTTAVYSYSP